MEESLPVALSNKNRNIGIFGYKTGYECKDRTVSQSFIVSKKMIYVKKASSASILGL